MVATITVKSPGERQSSVQHAQPLTGRSFAVRFRGENQHFSVHQLPTDVPIYRLANMRTLVQQARYVADRGLADDFFKNGQENLSAQQAQHVFLSQLARDPDKDIYRRLKDERQGDPLVLTSGAVVVNGNRRLAAMRDLHSDDPQTHTSFSHVDVVILPKDATESDITALETDLQIAPDLKLEYGWVEQALGLRRQINELNWSLKLAGAHWRESEDDLAELLNELSLAEQYLEFMQTPRQYLDVKDDDLAFQRLLKITSRAGVDPSIVEAERLVGFALIARKRFVTGRIWDYAGRIDKIMPRVLEADVVAAAAPLPSLNGASDDPLEQLPATGQEISAAALEALRTNANIEEVAAAAEEAYEEIRDHEKRSQRGARFAKDAAKLNSDASHISLANADPSSIVEGAAQLLSTSKQTLQLLKQVTYSHPSVRVSIDRSKLEELQLLIKDVLRIITN